MTNTNTQHNDFASTLCRIDYDQINTIVVLLTLLEQGGVITFNMSDDEMEDSLLNAVETINTILTDDH